MTEAEVHADALKYHLGANQEHQVIEVIRCETGGTFNPNIQSGYYRNGVRENSWGLAQINLPSWDITKEQATDPRFAIDFITMKFAAHQQSLWSCWRELY